MIWIGKLRIGDKLNSGLARLSKVWKAIVWEADATTWQFTFVSHRSEDILGYPVKQWLTEASFWFNHIHPDESSGMNELSLAQ
jgi:hypothetical protein